MAKLDSFSNAIKEALGIGRSLGDGFAWLFYRNESALLEEHGREQRQLLLPPKVGGFGERMFLEKMQGVAGMFVLYHGITSFLRLGDFSFYDVQAGRITTIGEVKTRHVEGSTYNLTLGCVAGTLDSPLIRMADAALNRRELDSEGTLGAVAEQRLKRQMDQIADAFKKQERSEEAVKLKTPGRFHFAALEDVVRLSGSKTFEFRRAGAGLVIGAWRPRAHASLGRRIFRKTGNLASRIDSAKQAVEDVLDPNLSDNCLFVSSIGDHESGFPTVISGGVPMIWWALEEEALRDIIFGHVIVITLFNPAWLWALLRKRGFTVKANERSQVHTIYRRVGEKTFEVGNFHYFERLVQHALMDESAVVDMIEVAAEQAGGLGGDAPVKMGLRPRVVI